MAAMAEVGARKVLGLDDPASQERCCCCNNMRHTSNKAMSAVVLWEKTVYCLVVFTMAFMATQFLGTNEE
jgi:hypothetical protein